MGTICRRVRPYIYIYEYFLLRVRSCGSAHVDHDQRCAPPLNFTGPTWKRPHYAMCMKKSSKSSYISIQLRMTMWYVCTALYFLGCLPIYDRVNHCPLPVYLRVSTPSRAHNEVFNYGSPQGRWVIFNPHCPKKQDPIYIKDADRKSWIVAMRG